VLGIELVAERGGADEIGEQKRRQLPLHCTRITPDTDCPRLAASSAASLLTRDEGYRSARAPVD
jgi:hypothetical protein